MSLPRDPIKLSLPDGRTLAFIEVGDPQGPPVMFFHGGADSRFESHMIAAAASRQQVRLIAPERPGFGASTPAPHRTLLSWADDAMHLADHLKLTSFTVMGHSAGGPYALATASAFPTRIDQVIVVAGAAPREAGVKGMALPFRMARFLALNLPSLHRMLLRQHRRSLSDPEAFISQYGSVSPGDQALFEARPDIAQLMVADMVEGYRQGVESASHEATQYFDRWDFALESVHQPVQIFVGETDPNVAPGWGPYLADHLPNATLNFLKGEGHISILVNHADAMFRWAAEGPSSTS